MYTCLKLNSTSAKHVHFDMVDMPDSPVTDRLSYFNKRRWDMTKESCDVRVSATGSYETSCSVFHCLSTLVSWVILAVGSRGNLFKRLESEQRSWWVGSSSLILLIRTLTAEHTVILYTNCALAVMRYFLEFVGWNFRHNHAW